MSTVNAIKPVALSFIAMWTSACIMIPIPADTVTSGQTIAEEEVLFIEAGVTTKQQVFNHFGTPNVAWEDQRVAAYNWEHVHMRLFIAVGGPYAASTGLVDVPTHHVLLIQFDEADRVTRFERTKRRLGKTYGNLLREWVGPNPEQIR